MNTHKLKIGKCDFNTQFIKWVAKFAKFCDVIFAKEFYSMISQQTHYIIQFHLTITMGFQDLLDISIVLVLKRMDVFRHLIL